MSVELIGCTTVAWDKFTSVCVKEFGQSPTRALDSKGIKVGDVASFAYSIEVLNQNVDFTKLQRSMDFIHLAFMVTIEDYDFFPEFCNLAPLNLLQFQIKHKGIGFFAGTLRDFRALIINGSHKDKPEEIRKTCNSINVYIELLGFTGLCGVKEHLLDKTYALKG